MRKCVRCCIELKCLGKTYQKIGGKTITINVYQCPNCDKLELVRSKT